MWRTEACCVILALAVADAGFADDGLRDRLLDSHVEQSDEWIYNDIQMGMNEAKAKNKPLFVTFRCVPCKACSAFDADVASGNERVRKIAKEKFVAVRQVEMKGVDLSLFQFDYDLNWAGLFMNGDGVVYARYGTQSSEGPDAYNSIEGLVNTMNRVLEMHSRYPGNAKDFEGKRGEPKLVKSALDLPGLRNRGKYAEQTSRNNCLHCHNVYDAEHRHALELGKYSADMLWKYPLPDNIGLRIDSKSGTAITDVIGGSPAARAGVVPGEEIVRMNGQRIVSIADVQWVLNNLPNSDTPLELETTQSKRRLLLLKSGWKRTDFSWRASMWNAPPLFQAWVPELSTESREKRKLPIGELALEVRWINRDSIGGRKAAEDGLSENDVIVAIASKPLQMTTRQFNVHLKSNYKVGDVLPLTIQRGNRREEIRIHLVE